MNTNFEDIMAGLSDHLAIGTDVIEVDRFREFDYNSKTALTIFTENELQDVLGKSDRVSSLAARFAAKEAVIKSIPEKIKFNEIEVRNDHDGKPKLRILKKDIEGKYTFKLSMSHSSLVAHAVCISIKV